MNASSSHRQPVQYFGRYRIIKPLGKGAMGVVYVAHDQVLARQVALKILPLKSTAKPFEHYLHEARAVAALEHPNIVRIYDVTTDKSTAAIAMEYLRGGNLKQRIAKQGPLPIADACHLFADAARGIAYAHEQQIIHRDIKPANLMLSAQDVCKVVDFGAAVDLVQSSEQDQKISIGTPYCIAPEIIQKHPATPACDIYSLGCSLWHALTGKPPYISNDVKTIYRQHLHAKIPTLQEHCPDASPALTQLLTAMLAKSPTDRPASMNDVANILTHPDTIDPMHALHTVSPKRKRTRKTNTQPSRHKLLACGVGLAFVLPLAAYLLYQPAQAPSAPSPSTPSPVIQLQETSPGSTTHIIIQAGQRQPAYPTQGSWHDRYDHIELTGNQHLIRTQTHYTAGDFELIATLTARNIAQSNATVSLGENHLILANNAGNIMVRGQMFGHPIGKTVSPTEHHLTDDQPFTLRITRTGDAIDYYINDQRIHASTVRETQPSYLQITPGSATLHIHHWQLTTHNTP